MDNEKTYLRPKWHIERVVWALKMVGMSPGRCSKCTEWGWMVKTKKKKTLKTWIKMDNKKTYLRPKQCIKHVVWALKMVGIMFEGAHRCAGWEWPVKTKKKSSKIIKEGQINKTHTWGPNNMFYALFGPSRWCRCVLRGAGRHTEWGVAGTN